MQTTVYVDLETGGLDIEKSPIIQIAAVAVSQGRIVDEYECKLRFDPECADAEALRLNSYNADVWSQKAVPSAAAMSSFTAFMKRHATVEMVSQRTGNPYNVAQLAGHNAARFDGPMIQRWYKNAGQFLPASFMVLDTLQLAMWFCRNCGERPTNFKLATLAEHFGVPCEDAHDALADVRMAFRVAEAIESRMRT